jgi:hypothetical protein
MTRSPLPETFAALALLIAVGVAGCAKPASAPSLSAGLGAPETFEWTDHPIAFATPAKGWYRDGDRSGGLLGVRFIKERSVGEVIEVAEYYSIGQRDGRAALADLLQKIDSYDDRDLRQRLAIAHYRTDDPINGLETDVASRVNEALDRAMSAHINGDADAVRNAVRDARFAADGMRFTLDDVVERVAFRPERHGEPSRYAVLGRGTTTVAGEPAATVDYTLTLPERTLSAREVYFAHDNHLYVASFLGLKSNLELFDRVVGSIAWPARVKA